MTGGAGGQVHHADRSCSRQKVVGNQRRISECAQSDAVDASAINGRGPGSGATGAAGAIAAVLGEGIEGGHTATTGTHDSDAKITRAWQWN